MKPLPPEFDIELIAFLQGDIPLVSRPYRELARKWDLAEEDVVQIIDDWRKSGKIRRYAAVLRHQQAGYTVNAMVAWKTPVDEADEIGRVMAEFTEVSHCYLREADPRFPYNLYTMIHSRSHEELLNSIDALRRASGLEELQVLLTKKELKKVSMKYV